MHIGYQQADRVAIDWFSTQNRKLLGTLHQNARELIHQDGLELVGLLDQNADAD